MADTWPVPEAEDPAANEDTFSWPDLGVSDIFGDIVNAAKDVGQAWRDWEIADLQLDLMRTQYEAQQRAAATGSTGAAVSSGFSMPSMGTVLLIGAAVLAVVFLRRGS